MLVIFLKVIFTIRSVDELIESYALLMNFHARNTFDLLSLFLKHEFKQSYLFLCKTDNYIVKVRYMTNHDMLNNMQRRKFHVKCHLNLFLLIGDGAFYIQIKICDDGG